MRWIVVGIAAIGLAQQAPTSGALLAQVREAVVPALPFPDSDADGLAPVDDVTGPRWMVRPLAPGDEAIDVLANPLNPQVQTESVQAMREIERAVEMAQRRSQAQYDRAVEEAHRTGKSQDVDGVTLGDEGAAGEKIDAESHVTIDVTSGLPAYTFTIQSTIEPLARTATPGTVATVSTPGHLCRARDEADERYCEAETLVLVGAISPPVVRRRAPGTYEVTAAARGGVVVRLRGNTELIDAIVAGADWSRVRPAAP